jgi:hypothetical protein
VALSADDLIQFDEGSVTAGTSTAVTLPVGTTAGNTVIVFIYSNVAITVPSGFIAAEGNTFSPTVSYKPNVGAGETSWTYTHASADTAWIAVEMSNIDTVEPYEGSTLSTLGTNVSNGGTLSTGTTSFNIGLSTVQFALFSGYVSSGTATKSWSGYTNGFTEITQIDSTSGTNRPCLAAAVNFRTGSTAQFQSTATLTISTGSLTSRARMLVFREAGSPISAPLGGLTGFEFGTHGGLAETTVHSTGNNQPLGPSADPPVGTWGTHYSIGSSYARNGDYGLRISTSAATCNVPIAYTSSPALGVYAANIRPVSGSGTPTVMTWDVTTGTDLLLVYDVATEKFGLRWGAGTAEWQTGTTPLNAWAWVEVRLKTNATTHHAEWWCETGTGDGLQTSPADLTGMTSTFLTKVTLSGLGSQTVTFDADDPVYSRHYAAFPLGPHKVIRLGVDTGGTATVSGTAANFNVFTANGTLAAFSSAAALAALDECPPTVSASADGLVQVTTASTDYVELPMQTYTLAADEIIAGVRMIASMWCGTGAADGNLTIKGHDGVSLTSLSARTFDAGSPTAISATEPLWLASPWSLTPGSPWTPTRLANAVLRVGYSSDATPDMGISAIYLEVAIKTITPVRQITSGEADEFTADVYLDPYNSASVSYVVGSTDATRGATFNYSVSGTPQTPVYVAASSTQEVVVNAASFGEISDVSLEPDPAT